MPIPSLVRSFVFFARFVGSKPSGFVLKKYYIGFLWLFNGILVGLVLFNEVFC